MPQITKENALEYHISGKIGIDLTKPCTTQYELSLAYTPGVAILYEEIVKDESSVLEYTNNVLGSPFIFRGALDVRARKITERMKMAAAEALAALAKEPVPYYVKAAYHNEDIAYGKEHIIPLPFNKEALIWVASAVAQKAVEEGVARITEYDHEAYRHELRCLVYDCPDETK